MLVLDDFEGVEKGTVNAMMLRNNFRAMFLISPAVEENRIAGNLALVGTCSPGAWPWVFVFDRFKIKETDPFARTMLGHVNSLGLTELVYGNKEGFLHWEKVFDSLIQPHSNENLVWLSAIVLRPLGKMIRK